MSTVEPTNGVHGNGASVDLPPLASMGAVPGADLKFDHPAPRVPTGFTLKGNEFEQSCRYGRALALPNTIPSVMAAKAAIHGNFQPYDIIE